MRPRTVVAVLAATVSIGFLVPVGVASAGNETTASSERTPATPLLSARRFPTALEAGADPEFVATLTAYMDKAVGSTCAIVEVDGRVILSRNADEPMAPASTMKLATAIAALDVLGADATLTTRFVTNGQIRNGVLDGDLWVVGGGDPLLTTKGYTAAFDDPDQHWTDFSVVIQGLRDLGVKRITGSVIGDDSRYDQVRWVSTWPQRYQIGGTVAPLSALLVNDGSTGFTETLDAANTNRRAGDPPLLFAQTLRTGLVQRGVEVNGPAAAGVAPADAREIGSVASEPVRRLVAEMITDSDNTTAELLTKEIGLAVSGQGTTAAGVAAIRASLQRQGFDISSLIMNDGSGLDTGDRMSCTLLLELAEHVSEDPLIAEALPVGGRTGTLRKRMLSVPSTGKVRAKTGTLNGINTLAGFVDTTQGSTLTFAFMHAGNDVRTTGVADGVTDRLVPYASKSPKLAALVPLPAR